MSAAEMTPDGGWQEAVCIVHDLEYWRPVADRTLGWDEVHYGPSDPSQLASWHLPSRVTGTEALFQCGEEPQGRVRFVQLSGVPQDRIRAGAMPWDTGGIFSLMTRSRDLTGLATNLMNHGFTAVTDPTRFEYGGRVLINIIMRGPDGICFGVYERADPPLDGWPHIKQMSQPFNAMQIVRSRDDTYDFHNRVLGMGAFVHDEIKNAEPKQSNFGIPINLTDKITTRAAIMHPHGHLEADERDNGRVELIEWEGLDGRDLTELAAPPNLGIVGLRFPVSDLAAKVAQIADADGQLVTDAQDINLAPYGPVKLAAVRTPDGVLYEFFERTG